MALVPVPVEELLVNVMGSETQFVNCVNAGIGLGRMRMELVYDLTQPELVIAVKVVVYNPLVV